jgi:GntR family transcriptional regulator
MGHVSDDNLQAFSLSDNSPIPKYHQLREILREQAETWQPHQPIPSEAELCRAYDVSRTTVRKALDNLVYEGLLYRVQGKGTYVAPRKLRGRYVQESTGFFEDMEARGLSQRTRVLEKRIIEADQFLADRLQLSVGEKVFYMSRLRFVDDEPAHISFSHVPYKLCPGLIDEDFTAQSLYRTMQKYGQVIHHGTRLIEVQFATHEESRLLKTAFEAPLLVVIGTMYDGNDVPIEYGFAKNRADCSQLEIKVVPQDHINL